MIFSSVEELVAAAAAAARIDGDSLTVVGTPSSELIDRLAHTSAFGATPEIKGTARWVIRALARGAGDPRPPPSTISMSRWGSARPAGSPCRP